MRCRLALFLRQNADFWHLRLIELNFEVQATRRIDWIIVNQTKPAQSLSRRILRHIVRFLLVNAVLFGPNLVFFGRWDYPDKTLPAIPANSDDQVAASGLPPELAQNLLQDLRASREKAGLPSLSAAIGFDGKLQWAGATGFANIENKQFATVRSRYRTGSVAKPITAVAMVRLMDAGMMDVNKPIRNT